MTASGWRGGYWDERCEVSYDYAGRAISNAAYTFNGYTGPWPNLRSPRVRVDGLVVTVSFL